jgi:hypothetical protein
MEHQWDPLSVTDLGDRFADTDIDWWVAGGYAIDLFLGWETRQHVDLDVEVFRSDSERLLDVFSGWDLHAVSESRMVRWEDPADLDDAVFAVWIRRDAAAPWTVEIMLADGDRNEWRFRRDPTVAIQGGEFIRTTETGIPYGTPEMQLLYKSFQARPKDDVDLARCLARMTAQKRSWLADAITRTIPEHAWIAVLAASLDEQHE